MPSSLPSPLYFHFHRHSSYVVLISSHHMSIHLHSVYCISLLMDLCVLMFTAPQKYAVLFILLFNPSSSIALLHSSSFLSTCSLLVLNITMSSAHRIPERGCSLMHRPITSSIMSNSCWGHFSDVISQINLRRFQLLSTIDIRHK